MTDTEVGLRLRLNIEPMNTTISTISSTVVYFALVEIWSGRWTNNQTTTELGIDPFPSHSSPPLSGNGNGNGNDSDQLVS